MHKQRLINTLGLVPKGTFSITDMQLLDWGRVITFACMYQTIAIDGTPDTPVQFDLICRDCRDIKYRVYAHISAHEQGHITQSADVAEINLGKGNHYKDLTMLTNHFSLHISYGTLHLQHDDTTYDMSD